MLASTAVPREHWRQIWSNNPLERLNRDIERRSDAVGIFANSSAMIGLIGAVLVEQHDNGTSSPPGDPGVARRGSPPS